MSMPTSRRQATGRRRREILDAALACFLQQGVEGTTIEQIRDRSGASHGSIYHHFGSKDEIALTLFVEGMQVYHLKVLSALEQQSTARGCVRAIIDTHLRDVAGDRTLALYLTRMGLVESTSRMGEEYRALNDHFSHEVSSHLAPYIDRGEIVSLPGEIYFSLIVGPAAHLSRSWLLRHFDGDLVSATDALVDAAWKSLQPGRVNNSDRQCQNHVEHKGNGRSDSRHETK